MMKTLEKKNKRSFFFRPDASQYGTTIRRTIALSLCALMLLSTASQVFAGKGKRHPAKKVVENTVSSETDKARANQIEKG